MIRLVILKVFIELMKSNPDIQEFQVRVNEKYLKEEVEDLKESKRSPEKKSGLIMSEAMSRGLKNSTSSDIT